MTRFNFTVERDRFHPGPHFSCREIGEDEAIDTECSDCLGEGGFRVYPSEHSHRTVWEDCRECCGTGRVPL